MDLAAARIDAGAADKAHHPGTPPAKSGHGVERFRDRRQLVHGDLKVADVGAAGTPWTKILSPKETRFSLPKGDYFSVRSPNTTHQKVSFPSGVQATPIPISS